MPLYDCMLLVKPLVKRESIRDLVARVARHAYQRNGVVTDIKSFGKTYLGYGIKKRDGRHYEGQLMQMTMMVPPSFTQELHYLNKEDRLLRWLVVKHRDAVYGLEFINEDDGKYEMFSFNQSRTKDYEIEIDDDEDEDDGDDDDYEYQVDEEEGNEQFKVEEDKEAEEEDEEKEQFEVKEEGEKALVEEKE